MSDFNSLPDKPITEGAFLFDDWNLSEKNPTGDAPSFEGKIIARMPDLGSNGFVKNIEKSNFSPFRQFWQHLRLSALPVFQKKTSDFVRSIGIQQQFFLRVAVFGVIVLLCGIGILIFDHGKNEPTKDSVNIADILSENTVSPTIESVAIIKPESISFPVLQPEVNSVVADIPTHSLVPVAPVANVIAATDTVVGLSEQTGSVWNRPSTNPYSPWDVTPRHPEHSLPTSAVATVDTNPVPPPVTVAMTPMTPMSMPVSPYERQLIAQSNTSNRLPVDPFVQANSSRVSGMTPMHERLENAMNAAPQNIQRSASIQSPYPPQPMVPGRIPMNNISVNSQHGQYGQYNQYATPTNYASSSNVPIPSGVSTLPAQNGYYSQPVPIQRSPDLFYYENTPSTYRKVY